METTYLKTGYWSNVLCSTKCRRTVLSTHTLNCCKGYVSFTYHKGVTFSNQIKGATSWDDLRTIDGVLYPTFQQTCLALGLLEDDGEWNRCLSDAAGIQTGYQLRHLFAMILEHCIPTQPDVLWTTYKASICDDLEGVLIEKY